VDATMSARLKQMAKSEGKSINQFILDTIKQHTGMQKKKKFTLIHDDLDHLFGKWTDAEFEDIQGSIDSQRQIDPELWG
ncbi:MAG: antitoxin, partial [Desulfobacterales bacterium]